MKKPKKKKWVVSISMIRLEKIKVTAEDEESARYEAQYLLDKDEACHLEGCWIIDSVTPYQK